MRPCAGTSFPSPRALHRKSCGCAGSRPRSARSPGHMPLRPVAKTVLFLAFAFTIMADPVSSVAYTIEASLRALHGHLGLLMATQLIVLAIILLIDVNYWQLVARFPLGGVSA